MEQHSSGIARPFLDQCPSPGTDLAAAWSAFLAAGLLDRLQVAVAPLLIGEGRRGLSLPAGVPLGDCLRPDCRIFRMGGDILFDCELRGPRGASELGPEPGLVRLC